MQKTTLRRIKSFDCPDPTNLDSAACEELRSREKGFDPVEMSFGSYGMTGALIRGHESQKLYKITARCTNLFYFV